MGIKTGGTKPDEVVAVNKAYLEELGSRITSFQVLIRGACRMAKWQFEENEDDFEDAKITEELLDYLELLQKTHIKIMDDFPIHNGKFKVLKTV